MKKEAVLLISLSLILILSIALVSAGWFSDFWSKITGKAIGPDTIPPTAPGTPTVYPNPTNGTATISWTAATDTQSGIANHYLNRENYDVNGNYLNTVVWVLGADTTSTTYTFGQGRYVFYLNAKDKAGNTGSYSVIKNKPNPSI